MCVDTTMMHQHDKESVLYISCYMDMNISSLFGNVAVKHEWIIVTPCIIQQMNSNSHRCAMITGQVSGNMGFSCKPSCI